MRYPGFKPLLFEMQLVPLQRGDVVRGWLQSVRGGGLYKLNAVVTHSLKGTWFQTLSL
jgi:hypothetical protein